MKKRKLHFGKAIAVTFIMAFVFAAMPFRGIAQEEPMIFVVVDFMKVNPGDEGKYVQLEKELWKPIHQERINQGEIIGWSLYSVHYTGLEDDYNFVTVAVFDNPSKLEHTFQVDAKKVHPSMDLDKAFEETMNLRQLVRKQLLRRVDFAYPEGGPGDYKYIQVNTMKVKPGGGGNYVNNEINVWKPVHQELINEGTRSGWSLWECTYPMGAGMEYDYVTVDYFKDFSKLGAADIFSAFKKAHPDNDFNMLMDETNKARKQVRGELWEVIDSAWKSE